MHTYRSPGWCRPDRGRQYAAPPSQRCWQPAPPPEWTSACIDQALMLAAVRALGVWLSAVAPGSRLQAVQLCEQVWQDLQGYGILPGFVLPARSKEVTHVAARLAWCPCSMRRPALPALAPPLALPCISARSRNWVQRPSCWQRCWTVYGQRQPKSWQVREGTRARCSRCLGHDSPPTAQQQPRHLLWALYMSGGLQHAQCPSSEQVPKPLVCWWM